ncbi:MAG: UvrD-helicase domain-containing protein [Candidatus Yanofskybacteria bacterium]|nr:UvrD-helicase domain-containing protein [Candidatus Yanofskybacteria bacterium]
MNPILDGLNEKQVEAVTTTEGPVLVISGPGSGKTRALTHRIAHLIASGVQPSSILAVTFTNKAAGEIKQRVATLLGQRAAHPAGRALPTIGTFHSVGLRILRRYAERIGYGTDFTILDSGDQQTLMRRIIAELELDSKRYSPGSLLGKVQKLKTELVGHHQYVGTGHTEKILERVYRTYQTKLESMNAVDFGDLIFLTVRLFRECPDVLEAYHTLWRYLLVDEYQDTSHDQYTLISMLASRHGNLFCIGDDAQSIYLFRQADIRNILNFQRDWPQGKVILLEQNYRSTKTILAAAQAVISNNAAQIPKELWTENADGDAITITETVSERHEAQQLIDTLRALQRKRYTLSDCAVLYRTHAQSRALEEQLVRAGIPYRIVGGIRFYERREVKDILAYARLLANPCDAVSFERIANVPARGIGPTTIDRLLAVDAPDRISAVGLLSHDYPPTGRAGKSLSALHALLVRLQRFAAEKKPSEVIRAIIRHTNYEEYLRAQKGNDAESAEERIENIRELLTVAKKYDSGESSGMGKFLEEVALLQDADQLTTGDTAVTLMTMHAAKGLEFPVVFVCGMEEGLFPHSRTVWAPHELEEERRLCYVAITRAKERLFMSLAKWRNIYGSRQANIPSRFIAEIPDHLLSWQRIDMDAGIGDDEHIDYDA